MVHSILITCNVSMLSYAKIRDFRDKPSSNLQIRNFHACDALSRADNLSRLRREEREAQGMKQQFLHLCKTRIRVFVVSSASVSIGGIGRNTATHPIDIIYRVSTVHTDKRHIVPVGSSIHARCQGSLATCLLRASNSSQISERVSCRFCTTASISNASRH